MQNEVNEQEELMLKKILVEIMKLIKSHIFSGVVYEYQQNKTIKDNLTFDSYLIMIWLNKQNKISKVLSELTLSDIRNISIYYDKEELNKVVKCYEIGYKISKNISLNNQEIEILYTFDLI